MVANDRPPAPGWGLLPPSTKVSNARYVWFLISCGGGWRGNRRSSGGHGPDGAPARPHVCRCGAPRPRPQRLEVFRPDPAVAMGVGGALLRSCARGGPRPTPRRPWSQRYIKVRLELHLKVNLDKRFLYGWIKAQLEEYFSSCSNVLALSLSLSTGRRPTRKLRLLLVCH
jgi:hypothetical protein